MNATPASVKRVQKYVFNFEKYRFVKKAANIPHPPLRKRLVRMRTEHQVRIHLHVKYSIVVLLDSIVTLCQCVYICICAFQGRNSS